MIEGIEGLGEATIAPDTIFSTGPAGGDLGKDEFLQLLIAQLRHQDPLSPMEADELAVQLAQFSSVEQLIALNEQIGGLGAFDAALAESVSTSAAIGLLGKDVTAVTNQISLDGSGAAVVDVDVTGAGGSGTAKIIDPSGTELASLDLGPLTPGRQTVDLGSLDQSLPPGTYTFQIDVVDAGGGVSQATGIVEGQVTGVRWEAGGPVLIVGSAEFPLAAVIEVSN